MSNIDKEKIGEDIILIPIEIIMRDETPLTSGKDIGNFIVNLHTTDGSHWVCFIRRVGIVYYLESYVVETLSSFF